MSENAPKHEEVHNAITVVIAHLDAEWGYCEDDHYTFGCASCEATRLKRQLSSIQDFLDE